MPNIVDIIEDYIKARLSQSHGGILVFRRNELAERFQCVPSQINYVLSTRFNPNQGYIIETRRGGGGFIRLIRVPLEQKQDIIEIIYEKVGNSITHDKAIGLISYLFDENKITIREAHIMENVLQTAINDNEPESLKKRANVLKAMLMVLLRHDL